VIGQTKQIVISMNRVPIRHALVMEFLMLANLFKVRLMELAAVCAKKMKIASKEQFATQKKGFANFLMNLL